MGSEIDLNLGTIKLGGSDAPAFNVNAAGVVTASAGKIGGWELGANSLTAGNMEISSSGLITTNTDTSKTRIVIDGSVAPSTVKFYSGSTAQFQFVTGVTAFDQYTTTEAYDPNAGCASATDSGLNGIELLTANSGIIFAGSGNDDVRITPGRIYLTGDAESSAGTYASQLHVRRQIGSCRNHDLDLSNNTSAIQAEYVSEEADTNSKNRSAISAVTRLHDSGNVGTPIAVYAKATTEHSTRQPYSFYGSAGTMHNNDAVTMGTDNSPGSVQLKVKMDRDDGGVAHIENLDTGPNSSVLSLRLNKSTPVSTNKYLTLRRGGGHIVGYLQGSDGSDPDNEFDVANVSDRRMKSNIRDVEYGLGDLLKIKVRNYEFNGSKHTSTGFIAQELHEVWPKGVGKTDNGTDPLPASNSDDFNPWTIDYAKLTPLLVKSVQDQQKIIDELTKRLEKLEQG